MARRRVHGRARTGFMNRFAYISLSFGLFTVFRKLRYAQSHMQLRHRGWSQQSLAQWGTLRLAGWAVTGTRMCIVQPDRIIGRMLANDAGWEQSFAGLRPSPEIRRRAHKGDRLRPAGSGTFREVYCALMPGFLTTSSRPDEPAGRLNLKKVAEPIGPTSACRVNE